MRIETPQQLAELRASFRDSMLGGNARVLVGMATCGLAAGSQEVFDAIQDEVQRWKLGLPL